MPRKGYQVEVPLVDASLRVRVFVRLNARGTFRTVVARGVPHLDRQREFRGSRLPTRG
jgi:hypothetical protein